MVEYKKCSASEDTWYNTKVQTEGRIHGPLIYQSILLMGRSPAVDYMAARLVTKQQLLGSNVILCPSRYSPSKASPQTLLRLPLAVFMSSLFNRRIGVWSI